HLGTTACRLQSRSNKAAYGPRRAFDCIAQLPWPARLSTFQHRGHFCQCRLGSSRTCNAFGKRECVDTTPRAYQDAAASAAPLEHLEGNPTSMPRTADNWQRSSCPGRFSLGCQQRSLSATPESLFLSEAIKCTIDGADYQALIANRRRGHDPSSFA